MSSPLYALLPGDIRSLASLSASLLSPPASSSSFSTSTSASPSSDASLSPQLPTLLLLECVLVYVPPADSDALLAWFATTWGAHDAGGGAVVMYDPFGLDDKFGEVMKRNLAVRLTLPPPFPPPSLPLSLSPPSLSPTPGPSYPDPPNPPAQARGLSLPGAPATPSLGSLPARLERAGVRGPVGARTVRDVRERCLPRAELERCVPPPPGFRSLSFVASRRARD